MKSQWSLSQLVFFFPAYLMWLLAIFIAGGTTLSCQRTQEQVDCTLSNQHWLGIINTSNVELKQLLGARIEQDHNCYDKAMKAGGKIDKCNRLVLDTAAGEIRPNLDKSSVNEINNYITSGAETFTLHKNGWIFSIVVTGFALLWYSIGVKLDGKKSKTSNRPHARK